MKRDEIIDKLNSAHQSFIHFVATRSVEDFLFSANGKWTAGQQLDHIKRSVKPLVLVLTIPKFMLKKIFGKANRQSKSYDGLVTKYLSKLGDGGVATGRFVPPPIATSQKEKLTGSVSRLVRSLNSKLNNFSERELDTFIIPHPLLGKLTLREMMYFTIYHVQHHHTITERNLLKE